MKITKDTIVTITFRATDAQGKLLEDGKEPRAYLHGGYNNTLPGIEKALEGRVEAVRLSVRLTESPSCLVAGEHALSRRLEEMLKRAGESVPVSKPVLELNPEHALVQRLRDTADDARFADLAEVLLGQGVLAEGGQLENPADFVQRLNRLILQPAGDAGRILLA